MLRSAEANGATTLFLEQVAALMTALGVVSTRQRKRFQEPALMIGQVKFFNTTKGFGFIAPEDGGKDVFVHVTAVQAAGLRGLNEGQHVSFDVEADKRGPKAVNLKIV
jgi:CspA family cold shock protein